MDKEVIKIFQKMIIWVKSIINRLFADETIPVVSPKMQTMIAQWAAIYEEESVHYPSLGIAAGIATEFARLTVLESEISFSGKQGKWLEKQLIPFRAELRKNVEYACALGGMIFKPYVAGDTILVDCIQADAFFPIAFDSCGRITSAVFLDQFTKGDKIYTRLESHAFVAGKETIRNKVFCSNSAVALGAEIPINQVTEWADILPEVTIEGLKQPLFAYFKVPLANNKDRYSPLGVSVFSNAMNLIEQANQQFARLLWEYEGGQLAIDVDESAIRCTEDGNVQLDQVQQRLYRRSLNTHNLYQAFTPSLRDTSYIAGLDTILKKIEFACNLSFGTLSSPHTTEKTATEIKMAKQRSYAAVCDIQQSLQVALDQLLYAMDMLSQLYGIGHTDKWEVSYSWKDSILMDEQTARQMDREDALSGFIPKWKYNIMWHGMTEQEAKISTSEAGGQDPFGFE